MLEWAAMGATSESINVPALVSLIICDQIIDDRLSNKKSAIGLFNAVLVPRVPAALSQVTVLASLTEIKQQADIELRLMRDSDNLVLFGAGQAVQAASPLATVDIVFALQGIRIEQAGPYAIELRCAGEILGRRRFQVFDRSQQQGGQQQ
jgi:hypothetical protein